MPEMLSHITVCGADHPVGTLCNLQPLSKIDVNVRATMTETERQFRHVEIYLPDEVNRVISQQARSLLLSRGQYARAILCAVARKLAEETEEVAPASNASKTPDIRSGVDDELTWRIYAASAETVAALIVEVLALPEDGIILVEEVPEDWHAAFRGAGLKWSYSPLDLGWFIFGPQQQARARKRHASYRVHGFPG